MTTVPTYLQTVSTDNRWRRIRERIFYSEIDNTKIGVVVVTMSPNCDNFVLNCVEHERAKAHRQGRRGLCRRRQA
jgi:hypothetical protein